MPRNFRIEIWIHEKSISYHARPCRAEVGCAWWLLCQPSPKVSSATMTLLRESSRVVKRRLPHMCVTEFTAQVECKPRVKRIQVAHSTNGRPPKTGIMTQPATIGPLWQEFGVA